MSVTLAELAARFDCDLHGNGETLVDTVGTLDNAAGRAISFLANPRYARLVADTRAGAVLVPDAGAGALVDGRGWHPLARALVGDRGQRGLDRGGGGGRPADAHRH